MISGHFPVRGPLDSPPIGDGGKASDEHFGLSFITHVNFF